MGRHGRGLPLAAAAVVVAAGAATILLRPRGAVIEPAAVEATGYFSPEQLERADDFRGPQRFLFVAGLGLSGATLCLLALRPPRRVRRALERAGRRPLLGAAGAGAAISLVLTVVTLPVDAVAHQRAVDVGLSTQGWGPWLGDLAKSAGIAAVFAAVGGTIAIALVRRFPRRWWLPSAAVVVAIGALYLYAAPVLIDPIFNRFEPLPRGELRTTVLDLARRAGVDVGEVYRVDASRRTTGANAYVGGLGSTKRVVLYDNLIEGFPRGEVASVVAHELGHVKERDVPKGLLWLAIVAPAATLLVQRLTERMTAARGDSAPGRPATLPALVLAFAVVSFGVGIAGNVLSRRVEARADSFALELTRDSRSFIGLERRLVLRNVSQPDPPAFWHDLFGTHPTALERIGAGVAYEDVEVDGSSPPSTSGSSRMPSRARHLP